MNKTQRTGFGGRGWVLIIQMFFCFFACFAVQNSINVLAPFLNATRGWSATLITSSYTYAGIITFIIQMIINKAVAKRSAKKGALIFGILFIIAVVIMGLSASLWQFVVMYIIMKIMADMWCLIENGILVGQWFPRKKGLIMGITTFGIPLAAGMGSAVVGEMMGNGLLIAFAPFIVIAVLVLILQQGFLADYPEDIGRYRDNDASLTIEQAKAEIENERIAKLNSPWTLPALLGSGDFWLVILPISFLLFGSIGIMTQVTSIIMSTDVAFYEQYGIMVLMLISFIACFGSWLCGFVDSKLGTKKALIFTCILMAITGLIACIGGLVSTLIACALMAIFMGGGSNYTVSASMEFWGFSDYSAVFSYVSPICSVLGSFGPMVIAIMAATTGGYVAGFILIAAMGIVGAIMIGMVRNKRINAKGEAIRRARAEKA